MPRGRRLLPRHRRGGRDVGHRGTGLHRHDLRHLGRQLGPLAGARPGQQQDHLRRGHRAGHSGSTAAAADRGHQEVRQAAHHAGADVGVRRLRVPAAQERRAEAGTPRLSGRDRPRPLRRPDRRRVLLRQDQVPHRRPAASGPAGHRPGGPASAERRAAGHRVEQRRLLQQGVGRAAQARRARAHPGGRVGRDEGAVPGRSRAVGRCGADGAHERGRRPARGPVLHADPRRVRLRSRCALHPHRPGGRGHRAQPAHRRGYRQRRAGRTRGACRRHAAPAARRLGGRGGRRARGVRGGERGVLPDRPRVHRRGPSRGHRQGARRLPATRRPARGSHHDSAGRLRNRPLHAALPAGVPAGADHQRRLSIRGDRPGRRLHARRCGTASGRRPASRAIR